MLTPGKADKLTPGKADTLTPGKADKLTLRLQSLPSKFGHELCVLRFLFAQLLSSTVSVSASRPRRLAPLEGDGGRTDFGRAA